MKTNLIIISSVVAMGVALMGVSGCNSKANKAESVPTEKPAEPVVNVEAETVPVSGISMKMVLDDQGNVVGRYVSTNSDGTYTIDVQDTGTVPMKGHHVQIFTPENGQGVVYSIKEGNVNVRKQPTTDSAVVGKIRDEEGDVPMTYPCLGKEGEWFKILFNGIEGYVREDLVAWDGMDTF